MAAGSSSVRADILWLCRAREPRRAGEAPAAARGGGRGRSSREAPALCTRGCGQPGRREGGRPGPARRPGGCGRPEWAALRAGWGRVGRPARPGPGRRGRGHGRVLAPGLRGSAAAGRVVEEEEEVAGRAHAGARCEAESTVASGATQTSSSCGDESARESRCLLLARRPLGAETERSPASVRSLPLPSPLPFFALVTPA